VCMCIYRSYHKMAGLLQAIVNKHIFTVQKCRKLLSKDGITSQELVIDRLDGLFDGITANIKLQRTVLANIGHTVTIAKNLDQYQFIICSEIPSMHDSNPLKLQLQKYRIAIIASFVKLVPLLKTLNSDKDLEKWNSFANILLTEASETVVKARTNQKEVRKAYSNNIRLKEAFDFFGVPEKEIDHELESMYFAS
jgi:hypothetical protein